MYAAAHDQQQDMYNCTPQGHSDTGGDTMWRPPYTHDYSCEGSGAADYSRFPAGYAEEYGAAPAEEEYVRPPAAAEDYIGSGEEQLTVYEPTRAVGGAEEPVTQQEHFTLGVVNPTGIVAYLPLAPGCVPADLVAHITHLWGASSRNATLSVARVTPLTDSSPVDTQVAAWETVHAVPCTRGSGPPSDARPRWRQVRGERGRAAANTKPSQYVGVVHVSGEAGWVAVRPATALPVFKGDVASRWGVSDDTFRLVRAHPLLPDTPLEAQCTHREVLYALWDPRLSIPDQQALPRQAPPSPVVDRSPQQPRTVRTVFITAAPLTHRTVPSGKRSAGRPAGRAAALLLQMRSERCVQRAACSRWRGWLRVRQAAVQVSQQTASKPVPEGDQKARPAAGSDAVSRSSSERSSDSSLPPRGPTTEGDEGRAAADGRRSAAAPRRSCGSELAPAVSALAAASTRLLRSRAFASWMQFRGTAVGPPA